MTDQDRDLILGGKVEIFVSPPPLEQLRGSDNGGCFTEIKRYEHESDSSPLPTVKVVTLFHVEAVRHKNDLH
jgi:hypothetical protein